VLADPLYDYVAKDLTLTLSKGEGIKSILSKVLSFGEDLGEVSPF